MSAEVERFVSLARGSCALLETATELEPARCGRGTSSASPSSTPPGRDCRFPTSTWTSRASARARRPRRPGEASGPQRYWEVFDPTHKETPVEGSVALDLSEIRFDLQQGLLALERGAPLEAVVWEWRWGLDNHWGNHLVNALRAIHWQAGW